MLKAAQLVPDDDRAISYAIDTIASSKDDKLANQLIDFLLGSDGLPKVVFVHKKKRSQFTKLMQKVSNFVLLSV